LPFFKKLCFEEDFDGLMYKKNSLVFLYFSEKVALEQFHPMQSPYVQSKTSNHLGAGQSSSVM
jgi:hypothetical protein